MFYFVKMPAVIKRLYPGCIWSVDTDEKVLYLTFDDGPHSTITPFVLEELKKFNAKATFFCIGKNVAAHPDTYARILSEGHTTGNHTYNHLNAWKTKDHVFLQDVEDAKLLINSRMFRPPYGKITNFQIRQLAKPRFMLKPIMWDVISGDFDKELKPERCLDNVILHAGPGSIVVFHDSEKAFDNLRYALPRTLEYFYNKGYDFKSLAL
jgi:peptidoglycan/xylan/chitin deacetylase (PgdA/CDA1 family)